MIWMEIQRSKAKISKQQYYISHGTQMACLLWIVNRTQNCGQPISANWEGDPLYTEEARCYMHDLNDLYIGDS